MLKYKKNVYLNNWRLKNRRKYVKYVGMDVSAWTIIVLGSLMIDALIITYTRLDNTNNYK